ncbi:MAG TPA: hypothetical protein VLS28_02710 [Candidatus Sulfomarinibacteraceae bacterium]|nr:hypothetical protein [Candidatus Sulfomarinibacteraceae bacterium]
MKRPQLIGVALAALLSGACSATSSPSTAVSPAPTSTERETIHVLEAPVEFTDVKVGSLTGCKSATGCQGDQLIGRSRMLDAATRDDVGTLLVICFLIDPSQSLYGCPTNTIALTGRGQIVYSEALLFRTASREEWAKWAPWPITGGTGEFLGATGTIDSPADSTWSYGDFVITIDK